MTGGCGFIASNFINTVSLRYPECHIVNLDKLDYCSNVYNVRPGACTFVKGDIKNRDLVTFLIEKYDFDTVFHFAAQSHVDNSFSDPVMFTYENVCGTHNLLEAFRLGKPSVEFIHFSTDEVYGTWVSGGGSGADFGHASVGEQQRVYQNVYAARGAEPWAPSDGC